MHDIKWIRENSDQFARGLRRRGMPAPDAGALIKTLLDIDERRRSAIARLEQAQARRNAASKEIGQAKGKKDNALAEKLMAEVAELKESIPALEAAAKEAEAELEKRLAEFPVIAVPTVTLQGDADGAARPDPSSYANKFSGRYEHRSDFQLGNLRRRRRIWLLGYAVPQSDHG